MDDGRSYVWAAVMRFARDEALHLGHPYLGAEHQLLGLLAMEDPEVTGVLAAAGITADDVREALAQVIPAGEVVEFSPNAELPYTSRAKRVLELAVADVGSNEPSGQTCLQLLRAILKEERNIAAHVLRQLGVDSGD